MVKWRDYTNKFTIPDTKKNIGLFCWFWGVYWFSMGLCIYGKGISETQKDIY